MNGRHSRKITLLLVAACSLDIAWGEDSLRALSPDESEALTRKVVEGHKRWEARLAQVRGTVHYPLLRDLGRNLQASPGDGSGTRAAFWQKQSLYREDVLYDEPAGARRQINLFTPQSYTTITLRTDSLPSVSIKPPATVIAHWIPSARTTLHLVLGHHDRIATKLLSKSVKFVEAAELTQNGAKLIVARLELTDRGAKDLGLPSVPPKDWRREIVWLQESADYAIVKEEYVGYDATSGHQFYQLSEVRLSQGTDRQWQPKRATVAARYSKHGQVFHGVEYETEFESLVYGEIDDATFTLEGLDLPPETPVYDKIRGKDYKWGDRSKLLGW